MGTPYKITRCTPDSRTRSPLRGLVDTLAVGTLYPDIGLVFFLFFLVVPMGPSTE